MDGKIQSGNGVIFFATGVFYYFRTDDVKRLFNEHAEKFPGAVLVFDSCNRRGARMMMKTWLREAGITEVGAFFSLENEKKLNDWSKNFRSVSAKSYMRGYRDIYNDVGPFHKLMIRFCDKLVNMKIVKVAFSD